jgi:hypothetical protein
MIFLIIYFIGCVISYIVMKHDTISDEGIDQNFTWTRADRIYCLIFSLFSWVLVIGPLVSVISKNINWDKKANW